MSDEVIIEGATPEEQGIIAGFFSGYSVAELARQYAETHLTVTENGTRTEMRVKEAYPIIAAALKKIKWGGGTRGN